VQRQPGHGSHGSTSDAREGGAVAAQGLPKSLNRKFAR
jgi:hypothetical protein